MLPTRCTHLLLLVLAAACVPRPPPRLLPSLAEAAARGPAQQAQPPASADSPVGPCGPEVPGSEVLLRPGRRVLVGELHGTAEIPAAVGQLACLGVHAGLEVVVGLELPVEEQPFLEAFHSSDGSPQARAQLLERKVWRRLDQDGRTSEAILALLEQVRQLRAEGHPVQAAAYAEPLLGLQGNARQEALARGVLALHEAHPRAVLLVLTGNVHARRVAGVPWDASFLPMGARLAQALPDLLSLDADYVGGSSFTCRLKSPQERYPDCRAFVAPPPRRQGDMSLLRRIPARLGITRVVLHPGLTAGAHDGLLFVGRVSPSPPAY